MTKMAAGVDVGGTTTKACVVAAGEIVSTASIPTPEFPNGLGELVVSALEEAMSGLGGMASLTAVGIGIPGHVDDGIVRNAANLDIGEDGYDLGSHVRAATGLITSIDNDTTVAGYGAFTQLRKRDPGLENLVYISLGTGVSAGLILGGRPYRGAHGLAGEFGHVPMGTGIECRCGASGCLETMIGAGALRASWAGEDDVFAAAAAGDVRAGDIVGRALDYLARAMWWLAATYDPDTFVIGGGISTNNPGIGDAIADRWREMATGSALARRVLDPDRVRMSDLEEPVGAYGAALLAIDMTGSVRKESQTATGRRDETYE